MKFINNSNGYTLLITFALIILITFLGLSLIALTTNGIAKNESRQDITQTTEQAEKGITYLTKTINADLQQYIDSTSMITTEDFSIKLIKILENYLCDSAGTISRDTKQKVGGYSVCIEGPIPNKGKVEIKKIISIKSIGEIDGTTRTVKADVEVGATSVPNQLKFALSTNKSDLNNDGDFDDNNERGDLFLHGGIDIHGDVRTSGDVILSDNAHWRTFPEGESNDGWFSWLNNNNPSWVSSKQTNIYAPPGSSENQSTLYMEEDKNVYKLKSTNFGCQRYELIIFCVKYFNFYDYLNFNFNDTQIYKDFYTKANRINGKLNETEIQKWFGQSNNNTFQKPKLSTEKTNDDIVDIQGEMNKAYNDHQVKKITRNITDSFNASSINGVNNNTAYIDGNINISNKNNVYLKGNLFVDGNVTIYNTNLNADCIIYTTGTVSVTYSKITGENNKGKFIIFSLGDIKFTNISENLPTPTEIQGFFYTNKDLLMYGVGSNILIHGGISAHDINLTAIRGHVRISNDNFENVSQTNQPSRLQIKYDTQLIEGFEELQESRTTSITELAKPKILNKTIN